MIYLFILLYIINSFLIIDIIQYFDENNSGDVEYSPQLMHYYECYVIYSSTLSIFCKEVLNIFHIFWKIYWYFIEDYI